MPLALLAISASPRKGGNSEQVLNSFVGGASTAGRETEIIRLNGLNFRPCQACGHCAATGKCVLKDDMQFIYPKLLSCEGLVISSPIFFGSVPAQLKMFIDRFQCWWYAKFRLKKPFIPNEGKKHAFFISVGALKKKEHYQCAQDVVDIFFHVANFQRKGSLLFRGYDEKGSITREPQNLQKAFQAGIDFVTSLHQR
jgi:multimeric flavodoxin WrbA